LPTKKLFPSGVTPWRVTRGGPPPLVMPLVRPSVCPSVCLSVCPSVKRVDCDKMEEKSVETKLLYRTKQH